jgi:hypothetical protein
MLTAPQVRYLFNMLDSNDHGTFSKEDVYDLLEMMMGAKVK